ncbi:hypothetical protein TrLO_g243 [Triparma laevis f. longispina]|uniref:CS domain-containing protein n=1 Tax=Triparma laevis f. longispina TaxID=1714387 RepID=A0A9W7E0B8_9STRA|nr:hypothetical protein TrLO_g243 [Triparma laevis f. longispina]
MSSFNYSKWDNLDSDDSCDDSPPSLTILNTSKPSVSVPKPFTSQDQTTELKNTNTSHLDQPAQTLQAALEQPMTNETFKDMPMKMTEKGSEPGLYKFTHEGRTVYEWKQNLETLEIYIPSPPVPPSQITVTITVSHLTVGIKDYSQAYIDEPTYGKVDLGDSCWLVDDGRIEITLAKVRKGELWPSPLISKLGVSELDAKAKEEVRKSLMLERFGEENPGFDFRGAEFNGNVPDAREFMGGVGYS